MNRLLPITLLTTVLSASTLLPFTGHETSLNDIEGLPKRAAKKIVPPVVIKEAAPAQTATSPAEPVTENKDVAPMQCAPSATSATPNDTVVHVYMKLIKRRHDRIEKDRQRLLETERRLKMEMANYYQQLCKYDQRARELYPQEAGTLNDIIAFIEQENTRKVS